MGKLVVLVNDFTYEERDAFDRMSELLIAPDKGYHYGLVVLLPTSLVRRRAAEAYCQSLAEKVDFIITVDPRAIPRTTDRNLGRRVVEVLVELERYELEEVQMQGVQLFIHRPVKKPFERTLVIFLQPWLSREFDLHLAADGPTTRRLVVGINLYPRQFKSYYFDLLGYEGRCSARWASDEAFCRELTMRHLGQIHRLIDGLLEGEEFELATFTHHIEATIRS